MKGGEIALPKCVHSHVARSSLQIPKCRLDRGLWISLKQGTQGVGHDAHRFERRREPMLSEPLQISPCTGAVFRWRRPFAPHAQRIDAVRCQGKDRFEAHITFPVRAQIVDIPKPLSPMEGEVPLLPYSRP